MYAKQVSRLYEPIEPISLPWELRSTSLRLNHSERHSFRARDCPSQDHANWSSENDGHSTNCAGI